MIGQPPLALNFAFGVEGKQSPCGIYRTLPGWRLIGSKHSMLLAKSQSTSQESGSAIPQRAATSRRNGERPAAHQFRTFQA
jgi:hypothetical protein